MNFDEIKSLRTQLILSTSNIARRELETQYKCQNKTIREILMRPKKWVESGRNLYLYGSSGTGKTLTGCAILKRYAEALSKEQVFCQVPIYYVSLPDFLNECKRDIGRDKDDLVAPGMIEKMKSADVVVMDEIGSIKTLSEYERNVLFEIVDARIRNMKASIYTSNSDSQKLKITLGEQLFSRVYTASDKIEMNGIDRRGRLQ